MTEYDELYEVGAPDPLHGGRERRRLAIAQQTDAEDAADGGTPLGWWSYEWVGRESAAFSTYEQAREAAMREGREAWPDLTGPVEPRTAMALTDDDDEAYDIGQSDA